EMGDDVAVIGAILYGELGLACQVIGSAHQATHTLQVVGLAGLFPGILTHLVILDGSPVLTVLDIALHKCGNQTARTARRTADVSVVDTIVDQTSLRFGHESTDTCSLHSGTAVCRIADGSGTDKSPVGTAQCL